MSASATAVRASRRTGGLRSAYAAEQRKLLAQTSTRVLALVCLLVPFAFALVISRQSGVPGDSLLGVWVHESGYGVGFVVLDFAGYLGLPVLAAVVAGDLFAAEDRYGTWKTVLTRSRSRRDLFAAKALVAGVLAVGLALIAAASSIAGALVFVGPHSLVGLSGNELSSGHALVLLLCGWLLNLPPLLGFVGLAILLSVASRSGIAGVFGTALLGMLMQLLGFLGNGSWTHSLLLVSAFDDWHGLLADPSFFGPLASGLAVSFIWGGLALWAGWALLRRREFAGPSAGARGWLPTARLVGAAVVGLIVLGALSSAGATSITAGRLQLALGESFERLTLLQQRELGRKVPAGSHLELAMRCARHGTSHDGPGDDWTCTVTLASAASTGYDPLKLTSATYDVSVKSNGCYRADAPPAFIGSQTMRDAHGRSVVNPLYTIYGCFDTTASEGRTPPSSGPRVTAPVRPAPAKPSKAERDLQQRQLREAEREAGPKVIREQEEEVKRLEREEREQSPPG